MWCGLFSATFPGKPFRSIPKASSIVQRIQEEQGIPLKEKRTSNSGMATSHTSRLQGLVRTNCGCAGATRLLLNSKLQNSDCTEGASELNKKPQALCVKKLKGAEE